MLRVTLFGPGRAQYFDNELSGFPQQRSCLLLSYLLLNPRHPHNRELLASLFWSDHPTQVARKYLRNALWRLRRQLQDIGLSVDEYLLVSDESVALIHTCPRWIDVEVFQQAIEGYREHAGEDLGHRQAEKLEAAAELYVGDLLEAVYEDWCLYDRERLRIMYLDALQKLMIYHGTHRAFDRARGFGKRLLSLDNTREKVHRQMMWLHWLAGERDQAVAQFNACRQILREELGIRPMAATRALYQQILREPPPAAPTAFPGSTEAGAPLLEGPPDNLTQAALRKLHRLQGVLEETTTELQHIEQLISQSLIKTRR